jgi:hypothetical protein
VDTSINNRLKPVDRQILRYLWLVKQPVSPWALGIALGQGGGVIHVALVRLVQMGLVDLQDSP